MKYLVFFFFCFNIPFAFSAEIDISGLPETEPVEDTSFKGIVNLPQPAAMLPMLSQTEGAINKTLLLGTYFNLRYPGDRIKEDLTDDVAQLFPELDQKSVASRARFIQRSVRLYRWGRNVYEDIKAKLLVPPEPPLIFDDDQYDRDEEYEYVSAPEGTFAIRNDFKKIVPYSGKPRDMLAMRDKQQRDIDNKKRKTNMDKFKSMIRKMEIRKLLRYGTDLPIPFIGNAGTTPWEEKEAFLVRMISEVAEFHDVPEFLIGVHIDVPGYRFVLGTNLSEIQHKPEITFTETQNVRSLEILYPVPDAVASDQMVGGYAGNFLIPIRVVPENKDQPVRLISRVKIQSCDSSLDCHPLDFSQDLIIETAKENDFSSFQNFIRQSYNNLPRESNRHITLEKLTVRTKTTEKNFEDLQMTFAYSGTLENFLLFVEDDENTRFFAPGISVHKNKIYATLTPMAPTDLSAHTYTITASLNPFDQIIQVRKPTINEADPFQPKEDSFYHLFLAGLMFSLTPVGFALFLWFYTFNPRRYSRIFAVCTLFFLFASVFPLTFALRYAQTRSILLYWGMQYQSPVLLGSCLFVLFLLSAFLHRPTAFRSSLRKIKPILVGLLILPLAPLSFVPFLKQGLFELFLSPTSAQNAFGLSMFALGASVPYLLTIFKNSIRISRGVILRALAHGYLRLQIFAIWFVWLLQADGLLQIGKNLILIVLSGLIVRFVFTFEKALYETDLTRSVKKTTERLLLIVLCFVNWILIRAMWIFPPTASESAPDFRTIEQQTETGKTVIVRFTADWCLSCRFAQWTAFNFLDPEKLNKNAVDIITVRADRPDQKTLDYMARYGYASPPLAVLYNYQIRDGIVLPKMLTARDISLTISRFTL